MLTFYTPREGERIRVLRDAGPIKLHWKPTNFSSEWICSLCGKTGRNVCYPVMKK